MDNLISEINNRIKEILSGRKRLRLEDAGKQPSSVLIPIYAKDNRHFLVLTQRSQSVRYHKGEVSFPGGGYDELDRNLQETALRESFEEIGLDPMQVSILGELDDTITKFSNYIVTPFVGIVPADYPYVINEFEIGELIQIPVDSLFSRNCYHSEVPVKRGLIEQGIYTYQGKQITGATARILKQFLEIYSQAANNVFPELKAEEDKRN